MITGGEDSIDPGTMQVELVDEHAHDGVRYMLVLSLFGTGNTKANTTPSRFLR